MKKNFLYLGLLLALIFIAAYLTQSKEGDSTLDRKMDYSFTIKDTAQIDRIVITDKKPSKIDLKKVGNHWIVNGGPKARQDAIDVLMLTFYRMEMRNFLQEKMKDPVYKRMSVYGKEVKIYGKGKLMKHIYIGTETPDEMATYMMIKNADAPYAVHIPGFNGFLSSRFFTQEELWRSREIFSLAQDQISEVEMIYPSAPNESFKIRAFNRDSLTVSSLDGKTIVRNVNTMNVQMYLNSFKTVSYEGAIVPSDPIWARKDSLLASQPVFRLAVKDKTGQTKTLIGYAIKPPTESFDPEVPLPDKDPDRLHAFINEKDMVLVQYYGLQNILQPLEYFKEN